MLDSVCGFEFRLKGLGCGVWGVGFGVWGCLVGEQAPLGLGVHVPRIVD